MEGFAYNNNGRQRKLKAYESMSVAILHYREPLNAMVFQIYSLSFTGVFTKMTGRSYYSMTFG